MIKEVERLFEAITGPDWEFDEETGELLKYNFGRTRKLTYVGWEAGDGDVFTTMGMSFLNDKGDWDEVFSLRHFSFFDMGKEDVMITAMARGKNRPTRALDYSFRYNDNGGWSRSVAGSGVTTDKRVLEDRQELLPSEDELPERIDLVLTANLFVDQMIRGEMERPILVPEGYFQYEEPGDVTYGAVIYSPNVTRVERLIAEARNSEELRMAKAINRWVVDQEMARMAAELD